MCKSPVPVCKSPMNQKNGNAMVSSNNIASALSVITQMKNAKFQFNNPTTPKTKQMNLNLKTENISSVLQNQPLATNSKSKSPNTNRP